MRDSQWSAWCATLLADCLSNLISHLLWKWTKGLPIWSTSWEEQRFKNTRWYWLRANIRPSILREASGPSKFWRRYLQRTYVLVLIVMDLPTTGVPTNKCVYFDKEVFFELGKCMWRNHHSVFQDHQKYIRDDVVKPFHVIILHYAERVQGMHSLEKYLPLPLMKGKSFKADNWKFREK